MQGESPIGKGKTKKLKEELDEARREMDKRLQMVEKTKASAQAKLEKEYNERLALDQVSKKLDDQKISDLQAQLDSIKVDGDQQSDRIASTVDARLQSFEKRFAQMIQGMLAESRSSQTSSEARMQNQLRSMTEKVRDEITGQLRELERDQVRKSDFDQFAQLSLEKLQNLEAALAQYDAVLRGLVDRIPEETKLTRTSKDDQRQVAQGTSDTDKMNEQEQRLLETIGEITRFRKTFDGSPFRHPRKRLRD